MTYDAHKCTWLFALSFVAKSPCSIFIAGRSPARVQAVLTLALRVLGLSNTALYDGSWAEYGAAAFAPLERADA